MPDQTTARRPARAASPRYRALTTITYPTDPAVRKRRLAGEGVPVDDWTAVEPGELVPDEIVAASPWLVRQGHVEPVTDDPPAASTEGGQ